MDSEKITKILSNSKMRKEIKWKNKIAMKSEIVLFLTNNNSD